MAAAPIIETRSLGRDFGKLQVLSGFDLSVEAGEVLGIIGPNGAGKSTLLSVIGGSIPPTSGRILLDGDDITRRPSYWRARQGVSTSYQIPRPFLGMTVFENLLVASTFSAGHSGAAARLAALDALEMCGLGRFANTEASALRLLDRKRLEVARALAGAPRVLLLDEIAGGLTESEVPELVALVKGVADTGVTVIWIEHVVHALTAVASRLLCLTYGKILAQGKPADVLASAEVRSVYLGIDPEAEAPRA